MRELQVGPPGAFELTGQLRVLRQALQHRQVLFADQPQLHLPGHGHIMPG